MTTVAPIKISGLRDFQAALRAMDGETQKQLRVVFNDAAAIVAAGARRTVPTDTGKAQASLRAKSGQREAVAAGGGSKAYWYVYLEGGSRYMTAGRHLSKSYRVNRAHIEEVLADGLTELVRRSGLGNG